MLADRVFELEKEFIIWGEILDEELIRYSYNLQSYKRKYLIAEDDFFQELLIDLDKKNEEYLKITEDEYCHPNYEKCSWRLNTILDIIYSEIESRRKR